MKLSIIIPVYNEEQTIGEVIERIFAADIGDIEKEIIVANDGSSDRTPNEIDASRWRADPRLRVFEHAINLGKGAAIRLGLTHSTGDVLLIQDADLELHPREYGALLAPILAGEADVVYGSRFLRWQPNISLKTRAANWFLTRVANVLFGARLTDMETGFKVFRRDALSGICLQAVGFDFEPEVTARLLLAGRRIREVPIAYQPRRKDEGKKIRWIDGLDALYVLFRCRLDRRK